MFAGRTYFIPHHTQIPTLRDGNCLFNSLALAMRDFFINNTHLNNQAKIDVLLKFNELNKTHFSWSEFVDYLKTKDNAEIQRKLAPALRELACELRSASEQQELNASSEPNSLAYILLGYFDELLKKQFGVANKHQRDDIFSAHAPTRELLTAKAEYLYQYYKNEVETDIQAGNQSQKYMAKYSRWFMQKKIKQKYLQAVKIHETEPHLGQDPRDKSEIYVTKTSLFSWWKTADHTEESGCQKFLNAMKLNSEWGGDIEASALARHAGFNLTIHTPNYVSAAIDDQKNAPTVTLHNSGTHWTYYQPKSQREKTKDKSSAFFKPSTTARKALSVSIENTPTHNVEFSSRRHSI